MGFLKLRNYGHCERCPACFQRLSGEAWTDCSICSGYGYIGGIYGNSPYEFEDCPFCKGKALETDSCRECYGEGEYAVGPSLNYAYIKRILQTLNQSD